MGHGAEIWTFSLGIGMRKMTREELQQASKPRSQEASKPAGLLRSERLIAGLPLSCGLHLSIDQLPRPAFCVRQPPRTPLTAFANLHHVVESGDPGRDRNSGVWGNRVCG